MGQLQVASSPFGEGTTRLAYMAEAPSGSNLPFSKGERLVLKVIKPAAFRRGIRMSGRDIAAQIVTTSYCEIFNDKFRAYLGKNLQALTGVLHKMDKNVRDAKGRRKIRKGEKVLLEKFIPGKYEKFNSNSGWNNAQYKLPNFFSHWTYYESRGKNLICDLQGHRGGTKYIFTDPVVMTQAGNKMGCTDLGQAGINDWFDMHSCNSLCRAFGIADYKPKKRSRYRPTYYAVPRTTYR